MTLKDPEKNEENGERVLVDVSLPVKALGSEGLGFARRESLGTTEVLDESPTKSALWVRDCIDEVTGRAVDVGNIGLGHGSGTAGVEPRVFTPETLAKIHIGDDGLVIFTVPHTPWKLKPIAKKNGSLRFIQDLQPANRVTIRDTGVAPLIEDAMQTPLGLLRMAVTAMGGTNSVGHVTTGMAEVLREFCLAEKSALLDFEKS